MTKYNMNILTFGTVAVLTFVALLSASLVILPIEANAAASPNFSYKQTHESVLKEQNAVILGQ